MDRDRDRDTSTVEIDRNRDRDRVRDRDRDKKVDMNKYYRNTCIDRLINLYIDWQIDRFVYKYR